MKDQYVATRTIPQPAHTEVRPKLPEQSRRILAKSLIFGTIGFGLVNGIQSHEESVRAGNTAEVLEFKNNDLADEFRLLEDDKAEDRKLYSAIAVGATAIGAGLVSTRRRHNPYEPTQL